RDAALADALLAVDRDEVRPAVALRAGERVLEQLELVVAADERRHRDPREHSSIRAGRCPGPDRLIPATHLDRADVLDLDPAEREPMCRGAEQDLSRLGKLLEARCDVDRLAGRERRVAGAGHDLSGLDSDAGAQLEALNAVEDLERGANRALRVVLVRLGHAERGHDGVAGELLDRPAVGLDAARHLVEEPRDTATHDLRVARGDERRGVDEVDEQDRGEFALHPSIVRTIRTPFTIPAVLDPQVFKAYDVRGVYPAEIDEEGARAIGCADAELFEPEPTAVGGDSALLDIRDRALSPSAMPRDQVPGQVREEDVFPAFVDKVLSFVDVDQIRKQRVVIDAANGMGGVMIPSVLERIPIDAVPY